MRAVLAASTLIAVLAGCGPSDSSAADAVIGDSAGVAAVAFGPVETVIGVLDQPASEVFGAIRDIAVDANGNIYILDDHAANVRVFDPKGDLLAVAGREGEGPGEFRTGGIRSAGIDAGGRLHILDVDNLRISTFELTDTALVFRESAELEFPPMDLCVIGDRRFVLVNPAQVTSGALIREVDGQGHVLNAFGEREKPQGELRGILGERDDFLNYGRLACDATTGTVVLLNDMFPLVRAFSADGEPLWRQPIPDYHQQRFEVVRGGRMDGAIKYGIPDPASGTSHGAMAVSTDGAGHVFASLMEFRDEPVVEKRYEVRVLDVRTGEQVARKWTEGVVAKVRAGWIYTYEPEPFPRVVIYAARPE
ncbi:MAG TPA: 6-bladed beta-propeller [Longimicrobiales bacterium]